MISAIYTGMLILFFVMPINSLAQSSLPVEAHTPDQGDSHIESIGQRLWETAGNNHPFFYIDVLIIEAGKRLDFNFPHEVTEIDLDAAEDRTRVRGALAIALEMPLFAFSPEYEVAAGDESFSVFNTAVQNSSETQAIEILANPVIVVQNKDKGIVKTNRWLRTMPEGCGYYLEIAPSHQGDGRIRQDFILEIWHTSNPPSNKGATVFKKTETTIDVQDGTTVMVIDPLNENTANESEATPRSRFYLFVTTHILNGPEELDLCFNKNQNDYTIRPTDKDDENKGPVFYFNDPQDYFGDTTLQLQ